VILYILVAEGRQDSLYERGLARQPTTLSKSRSASTTNLPEKSCKSINAFGISLLVRFEMNSPKIFLKDERLSSKSAPPGQRHLDF
jgi:hypothetical protein